MYVRPDHIHLLLEIPKLVLHHGRCWNSVEGLRRDGFGGLRRDGVGGLRRDGVGGLMMEICTETECLWPDHIHLLLEIPKLVLPPSMLEGEVVSNDYSEFLSSNASYFDCTEFQRSISGLE